MTSGGDGAALDPSYVRGDAGTPVRIPCFPGTIRKARRAVSEAVAWCFPALGVTRLHKLDATFPRRAALEFLSLRERGWGEGAEP